MNRNGQYSVLDKTTRSRTGIVRTTKNFAAVAQSVQEIPSTSSAFSFFIFKVKCRYFENYEGRCRLVEVPWLRNHATAICLHKLIFAKYAYFKKNMTQLNKTNIYSMYLNTLTNLYKTF